MCRNSSSSSHFLFPRDFSGTVADSLDIINTPLEPLRPADVPFWGHKTEMKEMFRCVLFILICLYFTTGHLHTCVLYKECSLFPF